MQVNLSQTAVILSNIWFPVCEFEAMEVYCDMILSLSLHSSKTHRILVHRILDESGEFWYGIRFRVHTQMDESGVKTLPELRN